MNDRSNLHSRNSAHYGKNTLFISRQEVFGILISNS